MTLWRTLGQAEGADQLRGWAVFLGGARTEWPHIKCSGLLSCKSSFRGVSLALGNGVLPELWRGEEPELITTCTRWLRAREHPRSVWNNFDTGVGDIERIC